jgi:hypothetical protein
VAATGGDTVGVRPGTYQPSIQRFITSDCSDNAASSVNWNTSPYADLSRATNWVTFKCDGARDSVKSSLGGFTVKGNGHVIFDGGPNRCFYMQGTSYIGEGGDSTLTTQNFAFYRFHFEGGTRNWGAQNILILDSEIGPSMKCGNANDPFVDDRIECDPDSPYPWEAKWANYQAATSSCGAYLVLGTSTACGGNSPMIAEPIWGINTGGIAPSGGRMEGNYIHDQLVKDIVKWHPGCLLIYGYMGSAATYPADTFVFTRNVCERIATQGVQIGEGGDGTTISNNFFGAPLEPPSNTGGDYFVEAENNHTVKIKTQYPCGGTCYYSPQNITIAYNTFAGGGFSPWTNSTNPITFTNLKFIGNLQVSGSAFFSSVCTATGASGGEAMVSTGNYGPGCTAITGTRDDNVVDADQGSVTCTWADSGCKKMDLHLTAGTKSWEDAVAASAGGLSDNVDGDDQTRSDPRTAGADER